MGKLQINNDQVYPSKIMSWMFDVKRASGHVIPYLLNRFKWYWYPRLRYVSNFPDHIDVEISSACNMKCPMCYTITDEFKAKVQCQLMDFALFRKIIDECASQGAYSIRLSLRGEVFIHPDVIEMIRYAKKKGIKEVSTLTNNLALTPELFSALMDAGLDWLTISFDGLGAVYEEIRFPAKFEDSYAKIKQYHQIKRKRGSWKPVIRIQTVWPAIKNNAQEYLDAFKPYVDDIAINPLVDYLHKDQLDEDDFIDKFVCPVLYQRLVIGSDGVVMLCSNDEFCLEPVGDANEQSVFEIWHGKKISKAREYHAQYRGVNELEPCKHCYLPRKTQPVVEKIGQRDVVIEKYIDRPDEVGK